LKVRIFGGKYLWKETNKLSRDERGSFVAVERNIRLEQIKTNRKKTSKERQIDWRREVNLSIASPYGFRIQ